MSLTNYDVTTYRDAVEQTLDAITGGDFSEKNLRNARRAVQAALRELANYRRWSYYYRRLPLATVAPIDTGTVSYDHAGGAAPRLVTLVDHTIDSSVVNYELIIGRARYEVDKYLTPTTFTLSARANPGADVASTEYQLVQDTYELPDDFVSLGHLVDVESSGRSLQEATLDEVLLQNRTVLTTSMPWCYATVRHPRYAGGMAIILSPSPSAARTYDGYYIARPKALVTEEYNTGTVSITAGQATVTGVGTVWTQAHVGAVLRFSSETDDLPTSHIGALDGRLNPYVAQGVVRSVESGTELTLEQAPELSASLAAVKYTLSDRIDVEAGAMLTAFQRLCEKHFAVLEGHEGASKRTQLAFAALEEAANADNRSFAGSIPSYTPYRLGDVAASVNP